MAAEQTHEETKLGDLPEACLAQAIALTSPRDACRLAAVSPSFRAAADSDHVWRSFLPKDLLPAPTKKSSSSSKKEAYLGLCDATNAAAGESDGSGCRVWLERATGARCCAVPARMLSLPWDDGEFSWKWTDHPSSRFGEVAELVDCTCLDIYGRIRASVLTPATSYVAYFVYGTTERHRGLSYPDQETTVSVGGRMLERHSVCLRPDDAETRRFRGTLHDDGVAADKQQGEPRRPSRRDDGWWEMEMGRLRTANDAPVEDQEVVASFEIFVWYPKCGLLVETIEFRPVQS